MLEQCKSAKVTTINIQRKSSEQETKKTMIEAAKLFHECKARRKEISNELQAMGLVQQDITDLLSKYDNRTYFVEKIKEIELSIDRLMDENKNLSQLDGWGDAET